MSITGEPLRAFPVDTAVLLADYEAARSDERNYVTVVSAILSVAVAILGLLGAAISQSSLLSSASPKSDYSPLVYVLLPLPVLILLSLIAFYGSQSTVRGFYLFALERQLMNVEHSAIGSLHLDQAPSPALHHLLLPFYSRRFGVFRFRLLLNLIFAATTMLFGALVAASLLATRSLPLQLAAGTAYAAAVILIVRTTYAAAVRGRQLWLEVRGLLASHLETALVPDAAPARKRHTGRSLSSYLLLPRPLDLVKILFIPAGILVGLYMPRDGAAFSWWQYCLFVLVGELLIYQTRYIVNDLHDLDRDAKHPYAERRRRIPDADSRATVLTVLEAIAARLWVAAIIIVALWEDGPGPQLLAFGLAVFVLAGVYEANRSNVRDPDQERCASTFDLTNSLVSMYVLVGAGYAIRVGAGVLAGLGGSLRSLGPDEVAALVVLCAGVAALGTLFVLMTWVLEASAFVAPPLPSATYSRELEQKRHLAPLARQAGLVRQGATPVDEVPGCGDVKVFTLPSARGRSAVTTAWGVAGVVAGGLLGAASVALAHRMALAWDDGWQVAVGAVVGSAGAAILVALGGGPLAVRAAVVAAVLAVQTVVAWLADASIPCLAGLGTLVFGGVFLQFAAMSYNASFETMETLWRALERISRVIVQGTIVAIGGKATARRLFPPGDE